MNLLFVALVLSSFWRYCYMYLSKDIFNYSTGDLLCKEHGKLYSDCQFRQNNSFAYLNGSIQGLSFQIDEGESVWINGYVEFTDFISWEGCFQINPVSGKQIPHNGELFMLSDCIELCKTEFRNKFHYVAIKAEACVCLDHLELLRHNRTENFRCDQYMPYFVNFSTISNIGTKTMNVFLVQSQSYKWDPPSIRLRQCVKAKKIANLLVYATDLCYKNTTYGSVCSGVKTGSADPCSPVSDDVCMSETPSSWLEAYMSCQNRRGLFTRVLTENEILKLNKGTSLWINMFRSFKIVDKSSRLQNNDTAACLAATRVGNKLVLDPDDCSEQKRVLCENGLYDIIKTDNIQYLEENNGSSVDGVVIYVTVGVVVGIAIITLSCCLYRKRKQHSVYHQTLNSTISTDGMESDPRGYNKYMGSDHVNISEPQTYEESKDAQSNRPIKPARNTIRKSSKQSNCYENVTVRSQTKKGNGSNEYDKIKLKGVQGQADVSRTVNARDGDVSVYNHTCDTDRLEEYDTCTLKSSKSLRQHTDDTYHKVMHINETDCTDIAKDSSNYRT